MLLDGSLRERITPIFQRNFSDYDELGAAISIWQHGAPVVELHGGFRDARKQQPWTEDTLVSVWSATKGIGSACLLHALQENNIAIESRVANVWPEFAQNGKAEITIAQLLSHSAGLCALDRKADVMDYAAVINSLEQQQPLWVPGTAHGYHARTFGFLIDELLRRIVGTSISNYWRKVFADPLELDFWIGLPPELNPRCATIYAAKAGKLPQPKEFYRKLTEPGTLQRKTFSSPFGLHAVSALNKPENRALDIVSFTGIGSASALAKFYAMLANGGELGGRRFFTDATLYRMQETLVDGMDLVFEIPTAFSAGLMKDSVGEQRGMFGPSATCFGHPGAGGSHAFADPENGISFAYVMNQMEQTLFPNDRALSLVRSIYSR